MRIIVPLSVSPLAISLLFISQVSLALPSVNDNTITWPEDGWYQVLDESDFSEICGGGSSCVVDPGTYLVINHTSNVRFPGIVVGRSDSPIQVSGNTISWPDDGWYQVQSSSDFATFCEGGRSCSVPAGNYIVINHSTGQRFTGINAPSSDGSGSTDTGSNTGSSNDGPIQVSGNRISWPDDGWYQVQNSDTLQSLCEGGASCEVPAGNYVVINHSSGERFDSIVVTGPGGPVTQTDGIPVTLLGQNPDSATVIERIGYISARDRADAFVSGDYLSGFFEVEELIAENFVFNEDTPIQQLDCPGGGAVNVSQQGLIQRSTSLFFIDCMIENTELDGNMVRNSDFAATGAGSVTRVEWRFGEVTITANGTSLRLRGVVERESRTSSRMGSGCSDFDLPNSRETFQFVINTATITSATESSTVEVANYYRDLQQTFVGPPGNPTGPCLPLIYVVTDGSASVNSTVFGPERSNISKTGVSILDGVSENVLGGRIINNTFDDSRLVDGPATLTALFGDGSSFSLEHGQALDADTNVAVQLGDAVTSFVDNDFRVQR